MTALDDASTEATRPTQDSRVALDVAINWPLR